MKRLLLLITLTCIMSCDFNDAKPIVLAEYDLGSDYPKIYIYQSFSNATTTESIQIRTEDDLVNAKRVFERYDLLLNHELLGDSLKLILRDTSSYKSIMDTFYIDINSLK